MDGCKLDTFGKVSDVGSCNVGPSQAWRAISIDGEGMADEQHRAPFGRKLFPVQPQTSISWQVLSRDSVTVSVDAVVYYRVSNPTMATNNIEDYSHSTRLLAATTLRNVLGTKNLAEILSERETISQVMQNALDEATDPWGVKVRKNGLQSQNED